MSCKPKRSRRVLRRDSALQKSAPLSACLGSKVTESRRTAPSKHQTANRGSSTPPLSHPAAHTKAVSPGAGKNPASQTLSPRRFCPAPAALPAASPSRVSARESPCSAPPDTKNPKETRHPPEPHLPAPSRHPSASSFVPLRSYSIRRSFCRGRLLRRPARTREPCDGRLPGRALATQPHRSIPPHRGATAARPG